LIEACQLHEAGRTLYDFIWTELCDWYIEAVKPRLRDEHAAPVVRQTLAFVLERTLRLLHPFMPYVTEELWQQLPHGGEAVIIAPWPEAPTRYPEEESQFAAVQEAVRLIRNARSEHGVEPARRIAAVIYPGELQSAYAALTPELQFLARLDGDALELRAGEPEPQQGAIAIVAGGASIFLPLAGMIDVAAERSRLEREIDGARAEIARAEALIGNEQFVSKAPEAVVAGHCARLAERQERLALLTERLRDLG
jgi:valyl-tRNA synthetase